MLLKAWFVIAAAFAVSCGGGDPAPGLPSPRNIQPLADENQNLIGVQWEEVPDATGYLVSFNAGAGEYTTETKAAYILFQAMDPADTYYVWIQSKRGSEVSPFPPNPLVIAGGCMSSAGIVLHGVPAGEKAEPDTQSAPDDRRPFDIKALEAERAAWESQNLTHYRFTRTLRSNQPEPEYSITVIPGREPLMVPSGNFQWAANPFEGREPVPALASEFASIDAVYAFLENYQGYGGGGQYTMVIRYNKEYHYPEYFSCSVIQPADAAGAGGRFGFEITNFEVLNK